MNTPTIAELASDYEEAGGYLRRKDASPAKPSPVLSVTDVLRIAAQEQAAMARVCEAAQARMNTYDRGEDATGGIKSVEWDNLRAALVDLERARGCHGTTKNEDHG